MAALIDAPVVADSVTDLDDTAAGCVVACGSHGGRYPGEFAAHLRVRGIVFNDAGVGREGAGIAGLEGLAQIGIPAAAVSHQEARIGWGQDTVDAAVKHVNRAAELIGCRPGDSVSSVLERFATVPSSALTSAPPKPREHRMMVGGGLGVPVWVMDSASLVKRTDAGAVLVTGSHGGAPGGSVERALKADAAGAVFNDAGGGRDGAGWSRLPLLDRRGIPAVTVAEDSARIGDGFNSFTSGRVVRTNDCAYARDVRTGMTVRDFIECISAASPDEGNDTNNRAKG